MTWQTPSLPRASREQVLAAVAVLEAGGPVPIGQIALRVAGDLGIDTSEMAAYDLRSVISWGGLQKDLKLLSDSYALVRRTEEDWQRVAGGGLFAGACSRTKWRYCTPEGALAVRAMARGEEAGGLRHLLAAQFAGRELGRRYPQEYAELVRQWLADNGMGGKL